MSCTSITPRLLALLLCVPVLAVVPSRTLAQADLLVELTAPPTARPGSDIQVGLAMHNRGNAIAPGTESRGGGGYMVDLFLTRGAVPAGFAQYSDSYFDGVLLRGGRASRTSDLRPGARADARVGAGIPADAPAADYRLCARIDPGNRVPERAEDNNLSCTPLRLASAVRPAVEIAPEIRELAPLFGRLLDQPRALGLDRLRTLPVPVQPAQPTGGGDARRTVLADGTIELRFPDGSIRRLRPDGTVETVLPDGSVMVPYAIQVQGADLPPLPEGLSGWGSNLGEQLLAILRNVLSDAEYGAYQQTEEGKDYYERVDWRLRSIAFLTSAE